MKAVLARRAIPCRSLSLVAVIRGILKSRLSRTMASQKPRLRLIFDWDGTMTIKDTTAISASLSSSGTYK